MAVKGMFGGLENITGTLASGDEVVVNDVSNGHTDKVYANHLSSFRKVTTLADAAADITVAQAGILLMPNSTTRTLTLPTAASAAGLSFTFVKTTAAASAITLDGAGSETINDATTFTAMDAQYDTVTIVSDGAEWWITHKSIA